MGGVRGEGGEGWGGVDLALRGHYYHTLYLWDGLGLMGCHVVGEGERGWRGLGVLYLIVLQGHYYHTLHLWKGIGVVGCHMVGYGEIGEG